MSNELESIRDSYQILHQFYSDDDQRKAYVIKDEKGFQVTCYKLNQAGVMICDRIIDVSDRSQYYAEDTAENWVTYVIK